MQAITIPLFGGPEVLTLAEIADPVPGPEELLVKVKATALNRADLLQRRGKYPPPPGESAIPGLEIAGEVIAKGEKVTNYQIGDRVMGLVGSGAYAELCCIDHKVAMPIPKNISYRDAAAIPEAFLTATEAVVTLAQTKKNETILIHAGGSGVGSAAIQIAKHLGAIIFTTVGSTQKMEKVKQFGADSVINYKTTDFANEIKNAGGVDVIIDFVGASYFSDHLEILKQQGRLIIVGLMGGVQTTVNLEWILRKRLQIKGLIMRARSLAEKRDLAQTFIKTWLPLFQTHTLKPIIDSVYAFKDVAQAHTHMESNVNIGKIILTLE